MYPIYLTGVRDGETLVPSAKNIQTKGTVFDVKFESGSYYPPSGSALGNLDEASWSILFRQLDNVAFFASHPDTVRRQWLIQHSTTSDDLYLSDPEVSRNLWVKFTSIGATKFLDGNTGLSDDKRKLLLSGNSGRADGYWNMAQVYAMFPGKPGSKARRHTLVFRPSNWTLGTSRTSTVEQFTGLSIDLDNGLFGGGLSAAPGRRIYEIPTVSDIVVGTSAFRTVYPKIGIISTVPDTIFTSSHLLELAAQLLAPGSLATLQEINTTLSWASPSILKSLIQKLIRTGTKQVSTPYNVIWPAETVLLATFVTLALNPGALVPDLQIFVSGLESALKRLAVSITEDSSIVNYTTIMTLYGGALLAKTQRDWRPTDALLLTWMRAAVESLRTPQMYKYQTFDRPIIQEWSNYALAYVLLDEIKSFPTDVTMTGWIMANKGSLQPPVILVDTMPLVHALDHHSLTEIALYFNSALARGNEGNVAIKQGFATLFSRIWDEVTGINPRKWRTESVSNIQVQVYSNGLNETSSFVRAARQAQTLLWKMKSSPVGNNIIRPISTGLIQINYTLDKSWIAGLVGTIELGNRKIIVSVRPDEPERMVAIRKPARDAKELIDLTEEEKASAITTAEQLLAGGYPLHAPASLPETIGTLIYRLVNAEGEISWQVGFPNKPRISWDEFANTRRSFPVHAPLTEGNSSLNNFPTLIQAVWFRGEGVQSNASVILQELIRAQSPAALRRILMYLSAAKSVIEMYKISRDGTGQEYAVVPEDNDVFHFLAQLSVLYPGVLHLASSRSFAVTYGPGLWFLRDELVRTLSGGSSSGINWLPIADSRNRILWEHQQDSLESLIKRGAPQAASPNIQPLPKRGHLIWIPVGLGKTLIVMKYIQYFIQAKKMPEYCVYSCPPSALDNTIKEIQAFGLPLNVMDLTQRGTTQQHTIMPQTINVILHDHLRLSPNIVSLAPKMLFVIDEFHKTLAHSQRTSRALEVARLSADFIGMSGTVIQNDNIEELMQWLSLVVDFEVTVQNFWVAVGAMISKRVQTTTIVNRIQPVAPFTETELASYHTLVGPALGGNNTRNSNEDFRAAVRLCQAVCAREMIRLTIEHIRKGDRVFLVAKDIAAQESLRQDLNRAGLSNEYIYSIGAGQSLTLRPEDPANYWVVITTLHHSAGYTLTKLRVMITMVYFSNEATREQLEGRINRIGQPAPTIDIYTVHTGILSYVLERYERARNIAAALKGLADVVQLSLAEIRGMG